MDEEIAELEEELARLRPRAVSTRLVSEVERQMAAPQASLVSRTIWWLALPIAAAAAAVVFAVVNLRVASGSSSAITEAPSKSSPAFNLVSAENILVNSRDEGL